MTEPRKRALNWSLIRLTRTKLKWFGITLLLAVIAQILITAVFHIHYNVVSLLVVVWPIILLNPRFNGISVQTLPK